MRVEDEKERTKIENTDETPAREEVKEIIKKSKNGKTPGIDGISIVRWTKNRANTGTSKDIEKRENPKRF